MNSDKILFFIFLLLFGCSSEHKKNTATQDWIGKSSSVLDLLDIKPIYISFCEEGEAVYGHVYNVKKKKIDFMAEKYVSQEETMFIFFHVKNNVINDLIVTEKDILPPKWESWCDFFNSK